MGRFDRLKRLFSGSSCTKMINYDKRNLEIKAGGGSNGTTLPLIEFKTGVEKVRDASDLAQVLDNYQYQMCRVCESLGKEDIEWKKYNKIRVGALHILTSLEATLIAFKNDPKNQNDKLTKAVNDMQDYLLLIARDVLPNIKDIESKDHISMGDIPEVRIQSVTNALEIAGLNENDVDQFIEQVRIKEDNM
jgi:hypothetical protein